MDIIIIGDGQFGTALSKIYRNNGYGVHLIGRNTPWPQLSAKGSPAIFLTVPTQSLPELLKMREKNFKQALLEKTPIISTAKGLIRSFEQTPVEYLSKQIQSADGFFTLSGPSFAQELSQGKPTALVLASKNKKSLERWSETLSTKELRLYKSHDVHGVELCGALKNVYAIAAGMCDGLNLGNNARAALTSRALAEMSRIVLALKGKPLTVFGLAGAGDLFLTCSSSQSRNYRFGYSLAKNKSADKSLSSLGTVEGAWTATVAHKLCMKNKIRAPLIDVITNVLNKKITPHEAIVALMSRKIRHEFE